MRQSVTEISLPGTISSSHVAPASSDSRRIIALGEVTDW
jgi:hypothetical protein